MTGSATLPGCSVVPVGYRHECECEAVLSDGTLVTIRPIRPDDAEALASFHSRLSADAVYRRFLGPHRQLSPTELTHFTVVDYDRRLALVAERHGDLIAVGRYDAGPGSDRAEVAFVVEDSCQHLGVGTLLLEHLAAAGRRRGLAFFTAETLATNVLMQRVFHDAGFECVQTWERGVADVAFPIAVTDRYLEAVLARDRLAVHARIGGWVDSHAPPPPWRVGVACSSAVAGAALVSACREGGLEISTVLSAHDVPRSDVSDLIAGLSADDSTAVIVTELEDLVAVRRLVARSRSAARRKPVLALVRTEGGGPSASRGQRAVWEQAGVEVATRRAGLVRRATELVRLVASGAWVPPPPAEMPTLTGCDVSAARRVIDTARASGRDVDGAGALQLSPCEADALLRSYGVDGTGDHPATGLALRITDDPQLGFHVRLIEAGALVAAAIRYLPLTDGDVRDLVGVVLPSGPAPAGLVDTIRRVARLVDDQADIELIEMSLGGPRQPAVVRVGPTRRTDDDPLVRRLPPAFDAPW